MISPLTDSEDVVRKYLQERYTVTDEPFNVSKMEAREGEHYLVEVKNNGKVEIIRNIPIIKHSYLCVSGRDYRKWKKIYLRKDKLQKIMNNVKIQ
jgi:hypothetical protein